MSAIGIIAPTDRLHYVHEGGAHEDCWLFVLDPVHDREAWFALSRYAELCLKRGRKTELAHAVLARLEEAGKIHDYRTE